jgi:hypothetical protein
VSAPLTRHVVINGRTEVRTVHHLPGLGYQDHKTGHMYYEADVFTSYGEAYAVRRGHGREACSPSGKTIAYPLYEHDLFNIEGYDCDGPTTLPLGDLDWLIARLQAIKAATPPPH